MEARRKRVVYRATHRGIKEMDIVLGGYACACVEGMGEEALVDFEGLLEMEDQTLLKMFMGGEGGEVPVSLLRVRRYWKERRVAGEEEIVYKRGGLSDGG